MKYWRYKNLKMHIDSIWNQYLHDVDEECYRKVKLAVNRIMEREGVMEQLKKGNPIECVRRVNGLKVRVEEEIINKLL